MLQFQLFFCPIAKREREPGGIVQKSNMIFGLNIESVNFKQNQEQERSWMAYANKLLCDQVQRDSLCWTAPFLFSIFVCQ